MKMGMSVLLFTTLLISPKAQSYTIDNYIEELERNNVININDAVALLPDEIKSYFTLAYQGHGLRGTSYSEPAVIAFSLDGSFLVNIGSPNHNLGDQIEILQFNKLTKKQELYSLKFPLRKNSLGKIEKPPVNPQQCLSCHGTKPNALWGEYNKWHGFYGNGEHDTLTKTEASYLQSFLINKGKDVPYSYFTENCSDPIVCNFSHQVNNYDLSKRPNSHLGLIISRINAIKLAGQIEKSSYFKKNRHKVIEKMMCNIFGDQDLSLYHSLGLSQIDVQQLAWDGVSRTMQLVAMHLIDNLPMEHNKKLKSLLVKNTITNYLGNHPLYKSIDQISLYPSGRNEKLCKYLDRRIFLDNLFN